MGTRSETLINDTVTLGFKHIYSGVLTDAYQITNIIIKDPLGNAVHTINSGDIAHLGLGTYQAIVPANIVNKPGNWTDVWNIIPSPIDAPSSREFSINAVNVASQPSIPMATFLECKIEDLTSCMLKRFYLWPVWQILANGYYLPDYVLQNHIDVAITWMQRELGMPLTQKRVLTAPFADDQTPANPVLGVDYDEEGELLQWSAIESLQWCQIRLPHTNIIRVNSLRGVYGGKTVYRIPDSWVQRNELKQGIVRVRPTTAGTINNIVDNSGRFLDVTLLEALGSNFVPGFWAVDYTYGNPDSKIAKEICDVIMKKASITILNQMGMAISKGLSSRSASVDGLSTSVGFLASADRTMFGGLIASYENDLAPENLKELKKYYKGPSVFFI